MPPDYAARILFMRATYLFKKVEGMEANGGRLAARYRGEIGAIRAALFAFGWKKDKLPEAPYLDPVCLEAYLEFRKIQAERRENEAMTLESRFTGSS